MKKKNLKRSNHRFEDETNFNSIKKAVGSKDKSSKKRLSIYEDFEEDEEDFLHYEKFRKKRK
ncbi:MAG: hypothetical protein JW761_00695 [Prolixibacteraceae bacterium]|jgi:hypothetical protein|nr:hypothetical protein [Prolixibacteraceae bacterium]